MTLSNITWHTDEHGDYWQATLMKDEEPVGVTGSYYLIGEDGLRLPKAEQVVEVPKEWE